MKMTRKMSLAVSLGGLVLLALTVWAVLAPTRIDRALWSEFQEAPRSFQANAAEQDLAILIDYDAPVFTRRLWLVDPRTETVILNAHVSHAFRSGWVFARKLSNEPGSLRSCSGMFITDGEYYGKFGESMRIRGLGPGKNDNAYSRAIVFHEAKLPVYSEGCFATRPAVNRQLVDLAHRNVLVYARSSRGL